MRVAYVMPLAVTIFGYIEIGVKPGIVFNSLNNTPRPCSSKKKSHRARPEQPREENTRTARSVTSVATSSGNWAGIPQVEIPSRYLSEYD